MFSPSAIPENIRILFVFYIFTFTGITLPQASVQQERPLPSVQELRQRALAQAEQEDKFQQNYTYKETRTFEQLKADGSTKSRKVESFQIFPNRYGAPTYLLLSKDSKETSTEQRQKFIHEDEQRRQQEQQQGAEKAQKKGEATQLKFYDWKVVGRESLDGRPVIKIALSPNLEARSGNFVEKAMLKMAGYAWIDEQRFYVAKISMHNIAPIRRWLITSSDNSSFDMLQKLVDPERNIVFPERTELTVYSKMLGMVPYRFRQTSEFSGYQRFGSESRILSGIGQVSNPK